MQPYRFADRQQYRIAQLSDCHLLADIDGIYQGIRPGRYLQQVISTLQQQLPDAVILTGDLTQDHSEASYRLLAELCQPLDCPLFVLPGNHDDVLQLQQLTSRQPFLPHQSLQLTGWQLLLGNTKGPTPAGVFPVQEQQRLQQQLALGEGEAWLFCHHHPRPLNCFIDLHGQQHSEQLWQFIHEQPRIRGVAHGHSHYAYQQQWQQVQIVGCPATSVQFMPVADWQINDQGPQWCEWIFSADGTVSWQFRGVL